MDEKFWRFLPVWCFIRSPGNLVQQAAILLLFLVAAEPAQRCFESACQASSSQRLCRHLASMPILPAKVLAAGLEN
jgi:hypothetical protein